MDLLGPRVGDRHLWAFMAGFERWVIAKAHEYRSAGASAHGDRIRMERFLMRRRLDPAFDAEVLRRQLAEPRFLAHRKVMIDAILTDVLDEEGKHGTIKTLTSAPLDEARESARHQALGGGYTERQIRNILRKEYVGIARSPDERSGREAPYVTPFTSEDFAPEHLERFRSNLERESQRLIGADLRELMQACDDLRMVRPDVTADLRVFRDQVAASLLQLETHSPLAPEAIQELRKEFFPCRPLLTIFYTHLMAAVAGAWFENAEIENEAEFLEASLIFRFSLADARQGLQNMTDLTGSGEIAFLYGQFAAHRLQRIQKFDPCIHLWTALTEMKGIPDALRAVAYHNRSTAYLKVSALQQAAEDMSTAAVLAARGGKPYLAAVSLKCEAETRRKMGEKEAASELYRRALQLAGDLRGNERFGVYWNLACSHRRIGEFPDEAAYLNACLRVMEPEDERREDVARALQELTRLGVVPARIPLLEEQLNQEGGENIPKMTKTDSQRIQSTTKDAGFSRRAQSAGDKNG